MVTWWFKQINAFARAKALSSDSPVSGGHRPNLLMGDFRLGSKPVFLIVAVFTAALLEQFVRPSTDRFFDVAEILRLTCLLSSGGLQGGLLSVMQGERIAATSRQRRRRCGPDSDNVRRKQS